MVVVIMRWANHQRPAVAWAVNGRVAIATNESTLHSNESHWFQGVTQGGHTWKEQEKQTGKHVMSIIWWFEPQSAGQLCCAAESN